jgi:DNA-binding winged helix-turn-helix (wHTH) protein/Tol biopolymer transport system component
MTGHKSSVFRFEGVEVRDGEFLLIKETEVVPVEPKAFRVLIYLLQNPGRVVTKEEIVESVWTDCSVSDNSLTRSIATLRRLLCDDTREPRYIATVPTVGYRFLCTVEVIDEASVGGPADRRLNIPDGANRTSISPNPPRPFSFNSVGIAEITDQSPSRRGVPRRVIGVTVATAVALAALAFALVVHRQGSVLRIYTAESRMTASPKETPVTSSSISPDAKYLAYTDRTGFFIRQLEGGETNPLPSPKSLGPVRIESWFPDSAHLLVSSWNGGPRDPQSLWKISLTGATARKLVEDGENARVSPDGTSIAFRKVTDGRSEIWTIRPDTGEAHQVLASSASEEEYLSAVAWAPDSRSFAYLRTTIHQDGSGEPNIETIDLTSRKVKLVLSDPNARPWLVWTEKNSLVYSRFDDAPNQKDMNLWEVRLDAKTDKHRIKTQITSGHGFLVDLSASSEGKVLAFRRVLEPQGDVYIAELRRGKLLAAPMRLTRENWEDDAHSWTRDSEAVLFTSDRDGRQHIYRQAIDQLAPDLLVGGEHDLGLPRLSPQGSDILYLQYPVQADSSRNVQIRSIPLSGGTSRLILQAPGIWNHECARLPSTVCIYSTGSDKELRFFSFDSKTGAKTELSSSKLKNTSWYNWGLSPNGKYLAGFKPVPRQDVLIRIISLQDESEKSISLPGWIGLNGMNWAADGMSFWVSACTEHESQWGAPNTCTLVNADLSGRITPLLDGRDIHFFAAIPSSNGDRLALDGETADNSNVWIVKATQ